MHTRALTPALAGLLTTLTACATPTTNHSPAPASQPTPQPASAPYTPSPRDFTLFIRILKKECFGSAGCNVTFRINPTYDGPTLPDDQKLTVTYEVTGGEEPKVNSFEMTGNEATFDSEEFIGTRSPSAKLRARVTDVF